MKKPAIFKYLLIDFYSATPKYLQLANCIINGIKEGAVKENDILPSINELSFEYEISRDTAEKGYKHLKSLGILGSVPGKGYFVKNVELEQRYKIFLLFNKLSSHKKIVYDAFVSALGDLAAIDFYIYNNDFVLFKKLLAHTKNYYTHFVIVPLFNEGGFNEESAAQILNEIPSQKLVLLDKRLHGINGKYSAVYENFEEDIYTALYQARTQLEKYHMLKIVFPENTYYPKEILMGFHRFCQTFAFESEVIHQINDQVLGKGETYITLTERDLVALIEKILTTDLVVGEDFGVISYNETPLKKVILNGITTISTDFRLMGEKAASLILNPTFEHIAIPFHLTVRNSL